MREIIVALAFALSCAATACGAPQAADRREIEEGPSDAGQVQGDATAPDAGSGVGHDEVDQTTGATSRGGYR